MVPKVPRFFCCKKCDYSTSRQSHWDRHLLTSKHKMDNTWITKKYGCECGNEYSYKSGLAKHKNKCKKYQNSIKTQPLNYEVIVNTILQDNKELKQFIIEQNTKMMEMTTINTNSTINNTTNTTNNTTNNNNTNNNTTNNNFNIQMFLNVECKNAININDFVDSIQLTLEDLETTGRLGYVEGISKIFLNGLKDLNVNDRPIHCSDAKRETFYIKNNNIWEKDNIDREKIKLAIKKVASKNIKQIPLWQKANPDCFDSSSKKNDKYLKIVSNSMNGLTPEETQKNYDKIISKIAKEVSIKKI
jgi:hypothetical protein